jgi:energy-coupling factor transporter ATP-binding protein EcfA2
MPDIATTTAIHKPLVAIVGPSGSGKSTSLRNLDPATTVILDGEQKGFPFVGAKNFTIKTFSNNAQYNEAMKWALEQPKTELVIVESFTKVAFQIKTVCVQLFKGFDIWSGYSRMIRNTLNTSKNTKAIVVFTAIDEIVEILQPDGSSVSKRMIGAEGKELAKQGGIEPDMLVVLFTDVRKNAQGKVEYRFETNNDGVTTAKTPMNLFEERFIPNDFKLVVDAIKAKLL